MSLTREQLEKELADLKTQRDTVQANLYGYSGAIQVCEKLLKDMTSSEATAEPPVEKPSADAPKLVKKGKEAA